MLSENQLELIAEPIYQRLNKINEEYLELIGNKIKEIGELRPTDVHRLQQLYTSGSNVDDIMTALAKVSEKNISDIQEMFNIVAKENYDYSTPFYATKGLKQIPYADNITLQRYVKAQAEQTVNEYLNLAQHTAFAVFDNEGNIAPFFKENVGKVSTSLSETYTKVMDIAVQQVSLGTDGYQSSMRRVIKAIADSGIQTVDYATGYHRRLDTAVRQNVLWGIKQTNQGVADITGREFGADGYEIDYHSNPRPTHAAMGGRQYAIGKARTVKGIYYPSFDEVAGLLQDYGCLHFKFSILLGVSPPVYSQSELERLKSTDNETVEIEGNKYTKYEVSQIQRKLETAARHAKDRQIIAKASGDDELRRQEQEKINNIVNKYKELSDKAGLPTKMERMSVSGYHKVKTKEEYKYKSS